MSNSNATLVTPQIAEPGAIPAETSAVSTSEAGIVAAGVEPSGESLPADAIAQIAGTPNSNPAAEHSARGGVVPAANCSCGNGKKENVFALGLVGIDYRTDARRDSFRQLMRGATAPDGTPLFGANNPLANPYDPLQLYAYLNRYPSESTKLTWTLNLDLTPIYAIEAELGYADEIYFELREALRGESISPTDDSFISRVSVPGYLPGRTVRLFSGQVVPVVVAQHRGMFRWNTTALTHAVIKTIKEREEAQGGSLSDEDEQQARTFVRNFLDKLYFQLRNLGQSSPDRALNFSATNAFQAGTVIAQALHPSAAGLVPTPKDHKGFYTLDAISVSKSPYCRYDSDCWDVHLSFFDPVNVLQARLVFQFTIDVSDEMPVTLGTVHSWTQGQSVLA